MSFAQRCSCGRVSRPVMSAPKNRPAPGCSRLKVRHSSRNALGESSCSVMKLMGAAKARRHAGRQGCRCGCAPARAIAMRTVRARERALRADCDDDDPCTADGCAQGVGCGHTPLPAFDLVECRLIFMRDLLLADAAVDRRLKRPSSELRRAFKLAGRAILAAE